MQPLQLPDWLTSTITLLAAFFIFAIGLFVLWLFILYIIDVTQTKQAIRHNYPIIGRLRYFFEHLGTFFRQYFFAMDREELPFNRAERSWVYRAAKNISNTTAFGSTRDLKPAGTVMFVNCPFPVLETDVAQPQKLTIGPYCRQPYKTASIFNISGMSYGAISRPAVRALSKGAKMANCWLNTGEGGLSPYHLEGDADVVFQIGTARYGVRDQDGNLSENHLAEVANRPQVKMFELKLSQGAKPGKGGILPALKITPEISRIRGIPMFQDSISPNRHPDIDSIQELLDKVNRIREVTGKPVGFKCVIGAYSWLEELFHEINRRGSESAPDFITIDGAEGGTGAAPMSLIDYMGLPIHESLPYVIKLRKKHKLDDRIRIIASGKLITPADVAWALCVGADFVTSARGFMFALGCIQALQCNQNNCPTGITTHNKRLQKGLNPAEKAVRIANYARNMETEIGVIAHSCGVNNPRELQPFHARIVQQNGLSIPLDELYEE